MRSRVGVRALGPYCVTIVLYYGDMSYALTTVCVKVTVQRPSHSVTRSAIANVRAKRAQNALVSRTKVGRDWRCAWNKLLKL